MNTWEKHQTPRAAKSKYPGPDEDTCKHLQADENICTQMLADAPDIRERYTGNDIRYSEAVAETDARAREAAAPAFDSPDFKADLTSPITYAVNELGHLSPLDMQALASFRDDLPDDVIIYGINAACSANVRTWAYTRSILNRYVSAGFKAVGDVKAAEAARERQKANMVSDGHGGKVASAATGYSQRSGDDFNSEIDNSWMDDFMPKEG
jgi:DnaD/phage-associated family protein